MTTVFPSSRHSRTMRATCCAEDQLPFTTTRSAFTALAVECKRPFSSRLESSEPRQLGSLALLQIGNNLADHVVQLIGCFSSGNPRLPRQTLCQVSLLHPALMLPARKAYAACWKAQG